jgi:hypothetical protein
MGGICSMYWEMRNEYKILIRNPQRIRPPETPRLRFQVNIEIDLIKLILNLGN